jgi:hypothetical protein
VHFQEHLPRPTALECPNVDGVRQPQRADPPAAASSRSVHDPHARLLDVLDEAAVVAGSFGRSVWWRCTDRGSVQAPPPFRKSTLTQERGRRPASERPGQHLRCPGPLETMGLKERAVWGLAFPSQPFLPIPRAHPARSKSIRLAHGRGLRQRAMALLRLGRRAGPARHEQLLLRRSCGLTGRCLPVAGEASRRGPAALRQRAERSGRGNPSDKPSAAACPGPCATRSCSSSMVAVWWEEKETARPPPALDSSRSASTMSSTSMKEKTGPRLSPPARPSHQKHALVHELEEEEVLAGSPGPRDARGPGHGHRQRGSW